jgi:hypothetical protein
MATTPYDHLVDSASSLDNENIQALIDDLQLMLNEREESDDDEGEDDAPST